MTSGNETNLDRHRRAVEAYNARDIDTLIALFDTDAEIHSLFAAAFGSVYRGVAGVRRWHRDLEETWVDTRLEPEAYFDLGDRTVGFMVYHGRGRESGVDVTTPIAQVVAWRGGRAVRLRTYADRKEALDDLGLSETALERLEP